MIPVAGTSKKEGSAGTTTDLLFGFLRQRNGSLSKRAREREFAALTDEEAATIEAIYREEF